MEWLPARPITRKFCNLILARREGGAFTLGEYRTDLRVPEEHPRRTYDGRATCDGGL